MRLRKTTLDDRHFFWRAMMLSTYAAIVLLGAVKLLLNSG